MLLVQTRGWDCAGALGVSTFQERYFLVTKCAGPGRWSPLTSSPPEGLQESSFGFASHGDDDFSFDAPSSKIPERFRDLA